MRKPDDIDAEALGAFLRERVPGVHGPLQLRRFRGGYSNLTFLVQSEGRELVVRCPPSGTKAATAHDMEREFRVLSGLRPHFPLCPEPLAYCGDRSVIGRPFYAMERLYGVVLDRRSVRKSGIRAAQLSGVCERLVDVQADLHRLDCRQLPFAAGARPEGYVSRQLDGWIERYERARTPNAPRLRSVVQWLRDERPPEAGRAALVHNDFKLDNVLLDPTRNFAMTGVLDWEMATIGDPLMDLGCSLAYWVDPGDPWYLRLLRPLPTTERGAWTRRRLVERYAQRTGLPTERMPWFYVFGLFRIAGIAQQIYYRYYHGQTKDRRFRRLVLGVHALDAAARRAIRRGSF